MASPGESHCVCTGVDELLHVLELPGQAHGDPVSPEEAVGLRYVANAVLLAVEGPVGPAHVLLADVAQRVPPVADVGVSAELPKPDGNRARGPRLAVGTGALQQEAPVPVELPGKAAVGHQLLPAVDDRAQHRRHEHHGQEEPRAQDAPCARGGHRLFPREERGTPAKVPLPTAGRLRPLFAGSWARPLFPWRRLPGAARHCLGRVRLGVGLLPLPAGGHAPEEAEAEQQPVQPQDQAEHAEGEGNERGERPHGCHGR
mmetsp:Transcript_42882/g.123989  ORF Transcript_42882/g.123989 Transcript_42882/m.123989 type:complete len:258 (+) Transcript_42882:160-933(+)